jgi:hypothetical protein
MAAQCEFKKPFRLKYHFLQLLMGHRSCVTSKLLLTVRPGLARVWAWVRQAIDMFRLSSYATLHRLLPVSM